MKKIKLITSLTALGTLATATPIVVTGCSSSPTVESIDVEAMTGVSLLGANATTAATKLGTFQLLDKDGNAIKTDKTADISFVIPSAAAGLAASNLELSYADGTYTVNIKSGFTPSDVSSNTSVAIGVKCGDKESEDDLTFTVNAWVRIEASYKKDSSTTTGVSITSGSQVSDAIGNGASVTFTLKNCSVTASKIKWACNTLSSVGSITEGSPATTATWTGAATAAAVANQMIYVAAFDTTSTTNPEIIAVFMFYNKGTQLTLSNPTASTTEGSFTPGSGINPAVWTLPATTAASDTLGFTKPSAISGVATWSAVSVQWNGTNFTTAAVATSSADLTWSAITLTYASGKTVVPQYIFITCSGSEGGANYFVSIAKSSS